MSFLCEVSNEANDIIYEQNIAIDRCIVCIAFSSTIADRAVIYSISIKREKVEKDAFLVVFG